MTSIILLITISKSIKKLKKTHKNMLIKKKFLNKKQTFKKKYKQKMKCKKFIVKVNHIEKEKKKKYF